MHGTTMMFLFAVPIMQGFAVYLVPLMIGTRNTAFPRMTACAYWIYLDRRAHALRRLRLQYRRRRGLVRLRASRRSRVRHRQARGLLERAGQFHRGDGPDGRRRHRDHHSQDARARHVAAAHAAVRVGVAGHRDHDHLRDADGDAGAPTWCSSIAWSARISSIRPKAATRCSGSTCSGSSAIRRSTSSSSRRWASSRRSSRPSRGGRCSDTTPSCCR